MSDSSNICQSQVYNQNCVYSVVIKMEYNIFPLINSDLLISGTYSNLLRVNILINERKEIPPYPNPTNSYIFHNR